MLRSNSRWIDISFRVGAILIALIFTTLVLLAANGQPFEAYKNILIGAFSTPSRLADVTVAWMPLLLASSGLLITFSTGLWNIGVEGQITLGAIFTTWMLRLLQDGSVSPVLAIGLGILAGALGGALWAALVGALRIYGGVNEIFGGLGLNFVATALTLWLIFGPWKRPGVGSMSGTEPFKDALWLPMIGGTRLSIYSILLGVAGIALVYIILQGTYFGLRLKAVGKNGRAAFLLGIPTDRYMMIAFLLCGMLAGLAGAVQVVGVYHRLIPSISSGYGFLGMMVAMLVNYQPIWTLFVSFLFAALNLGSIQLPIVLKLDSALSGVLQGALVLSVLMMDGVRRRFTGKG